VLVILREEYCWLVAGGWFVLREKYCWLVADKPSEQGEVALEQRTVAHGLPTFATACLQIAVAIVQNLKVFPVRTVITTPFTTRSSIIGRGEIIGRYGGPYVPYVRVGHEWHPEDRQGQASSLGREDEITKVNSDPMHFCGHRDAESFVCHLYKSSQAHSTFSPCSFGLSATSQ
jgi:hypothetical protein